MNNYKQLYQERKELGLCTQCGEKAIAGQTRCTLHQEQNREKTRRWYEKKKMKGGENMAKRHFKAVSEKDFETVKTLFSVGLTPTKIGEVTGRSPNTINLIKKANTLDEYKVAVKAFSLKYEKKAKENSVGESGGTEPVATEERQPYQGNESSIELNTVLWAIQKELKRLADAWETPSQKKGFLERLTS